MSNLVEQLKQAVVTAREISALETSEREAYLKELKSVFCQFQEIVYPLVSEHGCILANFKWVEQNYRWLSEKINYNDLLDSLSQNFSYKYGYNKTTIREILESKNEFESYYELRQGGRYKSFTEYSLKYFVLVPN